MRDSFFSFYTTASKTRLVFYVWFLALAFVYIAVNRMMLSRPERDISFELAGLLTVMVVSAPVLYHFLQERRLHAKRLASFMELIRHEGTSDLAMARQLRVFHLQEELLLQKDSAVLRKRVDLLLSENYGLLINTIERKQQRFETALSVGTLALICTGVVMFAAVNGIEQRIIYVTAASLALSAFIRVVVHFEYKEILKTITNEILKRTLVTNSPDLKQTDREQKP